MSTCRISDRAKTLPKPNFFPIIPPISLAHARKLCRGKAAHNSNKYVSLLEPGKRPACCKGKDQKQALLQHDCQNDYKYVTPVLDRSLMEEEDLRAFDDLQRLLTEEEAKKADKKSFAYLLQSTLCGLVVSAAVEEVIRRGDIESVSLSKSYERALFKIRGKPTLFLPLKECQVSNALYDGKGQGKEALSRQKQAIENRKRRTLLANRKIFEDLEKQAAEDMLKELERPVSSSKRPRMMAGNRRQNQYRRQIERFREENRAEGNMSCYGEWRGAVKVNVHALNWERIGWIIPSEVDTAMPKRISVLQEEVATTRRRIKNVHVPDQPGLELVPLLGVEVFVKPDVPPELKDFVVSSKDSGCSSSSLKSMFACSSSEEALKVLPTLAEFQQLGQLLLGGSGGGKMKKGCLYDHGDGVKYSTTGTAPAGSNVVSGVIVDVDKMPRFVPAEDVGSKMVVPGQRVDGEFIPGASVRGDDGQFQFIPGILSGDSFVAGQFVSGNFVRGQVVHTPKGNKFVEGETVVTPDGLKFVAGLSLEKNCFVPGALVDVGEDEARFVPGQLLGGTATEDLTFIGGRMSTTDKPVFVPGQTIDGAFVAGQMVQLDANTTMFLPGEVLREEGHKPKFVPGLYEKDAFVPGITFDTRDGSPVFLAGRLHKLSNESVFVPGTAGPDGRFEKAAAPAELSVLKSPDSCCMDDNSLSLVFKKMRPKNGSMVSRKGSYKFYPEGGEAVPEDAEEVISGRMELADEGPTFVPGRSMNLNGIRSFIPGKLFKGTFVPGKVIQAKSGPKFVCGQVIQTEDGEKFLPGIVRQNKDGGKIFVPAMEIQTRSGPVLIPGQVIRTDNGLKFVPGDIVSTENGAQFVPGLVLDSPQGAKLLRGEVIDTPDGPRLLPPPDAKGDKGGQLEYCVQGFDINLEEIRLLLGKSKSASDLHDLLGGVGGAVVSPEALKALAEGFQAVPENIMPVLGYGSKDSDKNNNTNADDILKEELLDMYDSTDVRKIIQECFLPVLKQLRPTSVAAALTKFCSDCLDVNLNKYLMPSSMKLNPALEKLREVFEKKGEVLGLLSSVITCSIPGALRACCKNNKSGVNRTEFQKCLLESVEDSIKCLLLENGAKDTGSLAANVTELINVAGIQNREKKNNSSKSELDHKRQQRLMESLDCNIPQLRTLIKDSFLAALSELCLDIEELAPLVEAYIDSELLPKLQETIMTKKLPLKLSLANLRSMFEQCKKGQSMAERTLDIISGILTCSIPQALQDCADASGEVDAYAFKEALIECAESSILSILSDDSSISNKEKGLKKLATTTKDNESLFSKVEDDLLVRNAKQKRVCGKWDTAEVRNVVKKSFLSVMSELCENIPETSKDFRPFVDGPLKSCFDKNFKPSMKLLNSLKKMKQFFEEEEKSMMGVVAGLIATLLPKALEDCQMHSKGAAVREEHLTALLLERVEQAMEGLLQGSGISRSVKGSATQDLAKVVKEKKLKSKDLFAKAKKSSKKSSSVLADGSKVRGIIRDSFVSILSELGSSNKALAKFIGGKLKSSLEEMMGDGLTLREALEQLQKSFEKGDETDESVKQLNLLSGLISSCIPAAMEACNGDLTSFRALLLDRVESAAGFITGDKGGKMSLQKLADCFEEGKFTFTQVKEVAEVEEALRVRTVKKCDNPKVRKAIMEAVVNVFSKLCNEEVVSGAQKYVAAYLQPVLEDALSSKDKLQHALKKLEVFFQSTLEGRNGENAMNLLSGIVVACVPKALKKCPRVDVDQKAFEETLLNCAEAAMRDMVKAKGGGNISKQLVELAQKSNFAQNKTLIKTAAVFEHQEEKVEINEQDSPEMRLCIKEALMKAAEEMCQNMSVSEREKALAVLEKKVTEALCCTTSTTDLESALKKLSKSFDLNSDEASLISGMLSACIPQAILSMTNCPISAVSLKDALVKCFDCCLSNISDKVVDDGSTRKVAIQELAKKNKQLDIETILGSKVTGTKKIENKEGTATLSDCDSPAVRDAIKKSLLAVVSNLSDNLPSDISPTEKQLVMDKLSKSITELLMTGEKSLPEALEALQVLLESNKLGCSGEISLLVSMIASSLPKAITESADRFGGVVDQEVLETILLESMDESLGVVLQKKVTASSRSKAMKELVKRVESGKLDSRAVLAKCKKGVHILEAFDTAEGRMDLQEALLAAVSDMCNNIDGMSRSEKKSVLDSLKMTMKDTLLSDKLDLQSALELLKETLATGEDNIGQLISGLVVSSVPAALREATMNYSGGKVDSLDLKTVLLDCADKSLSTVLKKKKRISADDRRKAVQELVNKSKAGQLEDNKTLFAKCSLEEQEGNSAGQFSAADTLDAYDTPLVRSIIKRAVNAVLPDLCEGIVDTAILHDQMSNGLDKTLDASLMSNMKLAVALQRLKADLDTKQENSTDSTKVINLISGLIASSLPGALRECGPEARHVSEAVLVAILLDCLEDSIKSILEEEGITSKGCLADDMKAMVKLAKEEDFDDNKTFFDKVAAFAQVRCNNKVMDKLLQNSDRMSAGEVMETLANIMGSQSPMHEAFEEMVAKNPDFLQEVMQNLSEEDRNSVNVNAAELLQSAVVKTVEDNCQRQLDSLISQLEAAGEKGALTDEDIRSMLRQAIGLAKYMKRDQVAETLKELLDDPVMITAIKDDAITRDVLRKILVLRKLAGRDKRKRRRLEQLERFNSEEREDPGLKRLVRQAEVLTSGGSRNSRSGGGGLKKSKSMIKKSKSVIMTAKDIPMNAFMAMKNTADAKDEKWLSNFLSESVMEDVPWECSKALIILKDGFQAIIPREASRNILLGEASYTLIDDNGIEFYLSATDKMRRAGKDVDTSKQEVKTMKDLLTKDPHYQKAASRMQEEKAKPKKSAYGDDYTPLTLELGSKKKISLDDPPSPGGSDRPYRNFFNPGIAIEDDRSIADSMEKYRPHNYEFGGKMNKTTAAAAPPESSDINDIRDFYSGLGTRQRALERYAPKMPSSAYRPFTSNNNNNINDNGGGSGSGRYGRQQSEESNGYHQDIDPARARHERIEGYKKKNYWQDEVDQARARSGMPSREAEVAEEKNRKIYNWEDDTFLPLQQQPDRNEDGSTLSNKTRGILDKLKESTMALQDLNSQASSDMDDRHHHQQQQERPKGSRFLRSVSSQPGNNYQSNFNNNNNAVGRSEKPDYSYNGYGSRDPYPPPAQDYSYQPYTPVEDRYGSGRAPVEQQSRYSSSSRARSPERSSWRDTEDVDVMIADLKKRTTGRDMRQVLRDMEKQNDYGGGGGYEYTSPSYWGEDRNGGYSGSNYLSGYDNKDSNNSRRGQSPAAPGSFGSSRQRVDDDDEDLPLRKPSFGRSNSKVKTTRRFDDDDDDDFLSRRRNNNGHVRNGAVRGTSVGSEADEEKPPSRFAYLRTRSDKPVTLQEKDEDKSYASRYKAVDQRSARGSSKTVNDEKEPPVSSGKKRFEDQEDDFQSRLASYRTFRDGGKDEEVGGNNRKPLGKASSTFGNKGSIATAGDSDDE